MSRGNLHPAAAVAAAAAVAVAAAEPLLGSGSEWHLRLNHA